MERTNADRFSRKGTYRIYNYLQLCDQFSMVLHHGAPGSWSRRIGITIPHGKWGIRLLRLRRKWQTAGNAKGVRECAVISASKSQRL